MPSVPEGPTPPPRKTRVRVSGLPVEVPQTMPHQGRQYLPQLYYPEHRIVSLLKYLCYQLQNKQSGNTNRCYEIQIIERNSYDLILFYRQVLQFRFIGELFSSKDIRFCFLLISQWEGCRKKQESLTENKTFRD